MLRLMKVEWYRFWHLRKVWILTIAGAAVIALLPLQDAAAYYASADKVTGTGYLALMVSGGIGLSAMVYPLFLIFLSGYFIHNELSKKTIYYEFMNESDKRKIIFSRIVIALLIAVIFILAMLTVLGICSAKNGYYDSRFGNSFSGHLFMKVLIIFTITLHLVFATILSSIWLRSGSKGVLFVFFRYYIWSFVWEIICGLFPTNICVQLSVIEPAGVIQTIMYEPLMNNYNVIFLIVLFSFVVNSFILYGLINMTMKVVDYK